MIYRPVVKKPCNGCPFRRRSLRGWLGAAAPERFINSILAQVGGHDERARAGVTDPLRFPLRLPVAIVVVVDRLVAGERHLGKVPRDRAMPRMRPDKVEIFATHREFIDHHRSVPGCGSWIGFDDEFEATPGKVGREP